MISLNPSKENFAETVVLKVKLVDNYCKKFDKSSHKLV